ncbi:gp16 family protein [Agitococcus lubricus]|uniref:Phage gp16-like protein n=1 Tax=Agitococcus lubricus TaxID=1077255 RepID=A0A2T5J3W3_9GAMM|nr:regulatory protein GemA [Agitococcus lubricus]PTQ91238.1 phage gp16-like protein [Agitococcus lubricus]
MTVKSDSKPRLIQLIHIAKSQLGMDDDTYRNMLKQLTQKDSTKLLTVGQLNRVVAHLQVLGFKIQTKHKQPAPKIFDPQSKKIRALWLELHRLGHIQDSSEAALAAYVKRITSIESLAWLSTAQASQVIETLKNWLLRVESKKTA